MTDAAPPRIVVLAQRGFLGDYVAQGLRCQGLAVVGPVDTADQLTPGGRGCHGAVVDIAVAPRELLLGVELISREALPCVLIGRSRETLPTLLERWPMLLQPFDSMQVVERLRAAGLPAAATIPA